MKANELKIQYQEYSTVNELSEEDANLVNNARKVLQNAYAPYSKFRVGAAVLLANGEIVTGTNQENAAYPSGLCAERVALFYANSKYPDIAVVKLAICADANGKIVEKPIPPCGGCRQVFLEIETRYKTPIKIILAGDKQIFTVNSAQDLMPFKFDEKFLDY